MKKYSNKGFESFGAAYSLIMTQIFRVPHQEARSSKIGKFPWQKKIEKDHENQIFKIIEYKALGLFF